ncbi:hypothetical protein EDB86DRAFT_3081903 [Lactarius hatsudake]|nr:hypothetical protein EDB86DRAFT_3081903 [Lactarius hatsudake]
MDPSQAKSREDQRQSIDAEIRSLEESIQALRRRRNALAPISSLPTEVVVTIFSFLRVRVTLLAFKLGAKSEGPAWLRVAHVCHRWREIALNQPLFWSHVDFTTVSSAGAAEILARAEKVPLQLEARIPIGLWDEARFGAFQQELQNHVSHISHLGFSAAPSHLRKILGGLVSPAPTLEFLSLSGEKYQNLRVREPAFVPDTLFDGSAPRLSSLELWHCNISWKSPLLRGLKHLEMRVPFERPSLTIWLDALDEMSQLKTLTLHGASPTAPPGASLPEIERNVTLPSLTLFELSSSAKDCGLALAHLILPALTSLCLVVNSRRGDGDDVQKILPYVARHAHGPQDAQPLQSMLIYNNIMCAEILAWTLPDMDVQLPNQTAFFDSMHSARVALSITNDDHWSPGINIGIFSAVIEALPLDGLVTLTAQTSSWPLTEQFWLRHAPKWPLLQRVRLTQSTVRGFREMLLGDDGARESPLLPLLTTLVLVGSALIERKTFILCDALMKRVELGVPLETLDLRKCLAIGRGVELLSEIVADVLRPEKAFEKASEMLSDPVARRLYLEDNDSSGMDDYDYDEEDDSWSDDGEQEDTWRMDGEYHGYGDDEAVYWLDDD